MSQRYVKDRVVNFHDRPEEVYTNAETLKHSHPGTGKARFVHFHSVIRNSQNSNRRNLINLPTVACLFSAMLHVWTPKSQQTRPCSWWWTVMRAGSHRQAGSDLRAVLVAPGSTLSRRMLMLSHFHLYGELRFSGVTGGATVHQEYAKMMMNDGKFCSMAGHWLRKKTEQSQSRLFQCQWYSHKKAGRSITNVDIHCRSI